MLILLLPLILLALSVVWKRSNQLPRSYRITLLVFLAIGLLTFAQALNFDIIAAKLAAGGSPQAQHSAHINALITLAVSVAALVAFSFFGIRGTFIAGAGRTI